MEESSLILSFIKPHKAVTSSTIARWIKSLLEAVGVDTSIFNAHSVRGASSSRAADMGITTNDILKAADWSSESVFQKFYYKSTHNPSFGRTVLSTNWYFSNELQTTPLILRLSILKYNSRMAQTTEWLQAIRNCMRNVKSNISTVPPLNFPPRLYWWDYGGCMRVYYYEEMDEKMVQAMGVVNVIIN